MNYYVYKYVNWKNEIEYIGRTRNIKQRVLEHRSDQLANFRGKVYYFTCANETEMKSYEYFLIQKYAPAKNTQNKPEAPTINNLKEPTWIEYKEDKEVKRVNIEFNKTIPVTTAPSTDDYLLVRDFAQRQGITTQAVYKSLKQGPDSKYYKYARKNAENGQIEISTKALNEPRQTYNKNFEFDNENTNTTVDTFEDIEKLLLKNELEFQKKQNELLLRHLMLKGGK